MDQEDKRETGSVQKTSVRENTIAYFLHLFPPEQRNIP